MTVQRFNVLFLIPFLLTRGIVLSADANLTIMVNTGHFYSVEEAAQSEGEVNWWDDDLSDDRACTECFAAMELSHFLPMCINPSGTMIQFRTPDRLPRNGDVIIVGNRYSNALIQSVDLPDSIQLLTDESFCLRAFQQNKRTITIIEGKDRVGTLYGVYAYLELLGIRFYGLGERGTVYPDTYTPLPDSLIIVENPSFLTRGFHAWEDRGNDEFFLWMARNRMNFWTAAETEIHLLKKLGMKLADGGHVIQPYFLNPDTEYPYNHPVFTGDEDKPADPYKTGDEYSGDTNGDGKLTYFEAHPEWYGLRNGKRSSNMKDEFGDNYCTSNENATEELVKNVIQSLIDGRFRNVDILNFWMMDARDRWCECDNCNKQGNHADRLFKVIHTILENIQKAQEDGRLPRNIQLSSLAYLETITPPTHPLPEDFDYENFSITYFPINRCYDHTFADPSCTEFNQDLVNSYLAWTTGSGRHYTGTMCIGEYYNISYLKSLPIVYTRIIATDIPWYYQTGTRHFHYMHSPTLLWGTWTLNQYLLAQLLWDASTDADVLLDEYFNRYYPTTSGHTRSFYSNLEKALVSLKTMRYWGWKDKLKNKSKELFPTKHLQYESSHPLTNDGTDVLEMKAFILAARNDIDTALIKCSDDNEKARLMEDERRFTYGEAMFSFHYHLIRIAYYHHNHYEDRARREFIKLEQYALKLRKIKELTQVASSHANASDGLVATQAVDIYTFFKEQYGN